MEAESVLIDKDFTQYFGGAIEVRYIMSSEYYRKELLNLMESSEKYPKSSENQQISFEKCSFIGE